MRVEQDKPLAKVEALDPGLPGCRRGKVKSQRSTQACLNLEGHQLEMWKKVLIPAFRDILGAQTNPWDNTNPDLLTELKFIYNLVLTDAPRELEHNGPEYLIVSYYGIHLRHLQPVINKACQCGCKWWAHIAWSVLQATKEYLLDACGESPTAIAEYVSHLLDGTHYMWEDHEASIPLVSN